MIGDGQDLVLSDFQRKHFRDYQAWFEDPILDKALGPAVDEEWLEHILTDEKGRQLVALKADVLAAVVGLVVSLEDPQTWFITDIAVAPNWRGHGVGRAVVTRLPEFLDANVLTAYVERSNELARRFFEGLGWMVRDDPKEEMLTWTWTRAGH